MQPLQSTNEKTLSQRDPQQLAQVSLKAFFNIMDKWRVKTDVQRVLLGDPARSTFFAWKKGNAKQLSGDTLERISYVLGIYKALGILFPKREQADAWPQKPNDAFNGKTALDVMANGQMRDLMLMRRYVDSQRG